MDSRAAAGVSQIDMICDFFIGWMHISVQWRVYLLSAGISLRYEPGNASAFDQKNLGCLSYDLQWTIKIQLVFECGHIELKHISGQTSAPAPAAFADEAGYSCRKQQASTVDYWACSISARAGRCALVSLQRRWRIARYVLIRDGLTQTGFLIERLWR